MRALVLAGASLIIAGLAVAACGGSASETPWPVEPDPQSYAPPGEQGPGAAADQTDAGSD